jgi:hypothetical protein
MTGKPPQPDRQSHDKQPVVKVSNLHTGLIQAVEQAVRILASKVPNWAAGIVLLGIVGIGFIAYLGGALAIYAIAVVVILLAVILVVALRIRANHSPPPDPSGKTSETLSLRDRLSAEQFDAIRDIVAGSTGDVAETLDLTQDLVRGNVFGLGGDGYLHMINDFNINMEYAPELALRIPPGQGCNGRAWKLRKPNIAIRVGDFGDSDVPADQAKRVAPNLVWILSIPVFDTEVATGTPTWILNADGLDRQCKKEQLERAVGSMLPWAEHLSSILRSLTETHAKSETHPPVSG